MPSKEPKESVEVVIESEEEPVIESEEVVNVIESVIKEIVIDLASAKKVPWGGVAPTLKVSVEVSM